MNNKNNISSKYFCICLAVVLISFLCLGAVLLLVSSRYFLEEKKSLLQKNDKALALYTKERMLENPIGWKNNVRKQMESYAAGCNADFILTDKNGFVILSTSITESEPTDKNQDISPDALNSFGNDCTYVYGNLNNYMENNYHIMGIKFKANGPEYYMLAYSSQSNQDEYIWKIMEIFGVSAVVVMVFTSFFVFFATMKITEPIKEFAEVSKKIGEGDFSVTLPEYKVKEFQQLSAAFNDMAANLKNYDMMRSSFITNFSHEIRTPMTSLGGFIDGIIDGTIPKEKEKEYLEKVSREIKRLSKVVKGMIDTVSLESDNIKLNFEKFSINGVIIDNFFKFEKEIDKKYVTIEGLDAADHMIYGDRKLIDKAVFNLVENAVKFVNDHGYIKVTLNQISDKTVISIKNSGEGLPEDVLPLLFDKFFKTDGSRSKRPESFGFGLNIVKSIIKLHDGKIMVRSVEHEYTEFIFTLPNKPISQRSE